MIWLRSFLFLLFLLAVTPAYSLIALATFPLPPHTRYRIISGWARLALGALRVLCGLRYRVVGRENIPSGPAVVLAKHQSAWETLAFQQIFPPQVWVLKRELLRVPFLGWGLAMLSPIAIDRSAGKEALRQVVDQGVERIKSGFWIVIFPEGTRVVPGQRGRYGIGGAWLATHAAIPVVPVAHNAGEFWGRNAFLKRPGVITVSIGPVIHAEGKKAADLNREVEEWIEAEMLRLKDYASAPADH